MTPEETADLLERLIFECEDEIQNILEASAISLKNEVVEEILNTGENADGQLGTYSTNPLSLDTGQVLQLPRRPSERFRRGSGAYFEGGYFELRADQGRQNQFVDLQLTGEMFDDLQVIDKDSNGTSFSVSIDGISSDTVDKLNQNFERYGDFLKPKQELRDEFKEDFVEQIVDHINRFLG